MTDTTLTPASQTMDPHGRAPSPAHKVRSAELARVWNERVDKIRRMREEYESLRQRRLRQLLDAERAAQDLRDKLLDQRRQRREEAKRKEDERRNAAEERRRQHEAEERNKLEDAIRRATDRESRFESIKRRAGRGEKYAFGSSLPRDFGSVFGSASASVSRAESDYEDNVMTMSISLSTKTSRSASPRREKEHKLERDSLKKERRAISTGPNGRRAIDSPGLSLAPEGVESPRPVRRPKPAKVAGSNSLMSTSMLVEYHSSLMPIAGDGDANLPSHAMTASHHRIDADISPSSASLARRTLAAAGSVSAASPRQLTPFDRCASPLRTRTSRVSPARTTLRSDEQLIVSVPIDETQPGAHSSHLLVVRSMRATTNGDTDTSDDHGDRQPTTRLRKPQAGRAVSPRKTVSRSDASGPTGRSQKQSSSPSRIPVSMRSSRSSKLERSHSAGASDANAERRSRTAASALSASMTSSLPKHDNAHTASRAAAQSSIPKPIRPRSADPERRNRIAQEDQPPATQQPAAQPTTNYAEWKAKIDAANGVMKDSISTPKRSVSPSKLPQSLRAKTPTAQEEKPIPPPIRGGVKSPLKVAAGADATMQASTASTSVPVPAIKPPNGAQNDAPTPAAPDSTAPIPIRPIASSLPTPKPFAPPTSDTSQPPTPTPASSAPFTNGIATSTVSKLLLDANSTSTVTVAASPQPIAAKQSTPAVAVSTTPQPSGAAPPLPASTTASAPAAGSQPAETTANANAGGGWLQFEQVMLAKRSEQLEEEWQKLKSEEERKQRELADRERALKAREAQLAELEKERLARKERLKNIMTRVRPGADELDAPTDGNRAQSMSMLADLRSQQLGLFGGAAASGPSTSSVLDAALQRESVRIANTGAAAQPSSCAEVEYAGAWAPSRRVMFAQAPLVLGGAQPPSAPITIQRAAPNPAVLSSILRSSRLAQPGAAELSSSAPPGVGGLAALGGISSLLQLRRQVEAAAANGARTQHAPPTGPS